MNKKVLISFISLLLTLSFTGCKGKYSNYILSCMGDSITYGYTPKLGTQMDKPYPTLLKERLGFGKVNNYGISGSTVSNYTGVSYKCSPMVDRLDTIDRNSNIVIFWGGGNDWGHDYPIGEEGSKVTTDLYGALYYVGNYLNNNFPNAFKMMITPLPTIYDDHTYYKVRDAIIYTGEVFNIPVLNMFDESGFEDEMHLSISDGIHPTQEFVKNYMVPNIYNFIKNKVKL